MRRWLLVLPLLIGSQASFPQASAQQSVPTINFDSVSNPLKLPTNMYFGEVSGVAVNFQGTRLRTVARQHFGSGLCRGRHATA